MRLFSDASSSDTTSIRGTDYSGSVVGTRTPADDGSIISSLVTARFKHVVTEDGHAVITGRDGDALQTCEDEPIHIPGAIVSFTVLFLVRPRFNNGFVCPFLVTADLLTLLFSKDLDSWLR